MNVGFISYLFPAIAFLILALLLVTTWRGRLAGFLMILAAVMSALWAGTSALFIGYGTPPQGFVQLMELLRDGGWLFFLVKILSPEEPAQAGVGRERKWAILASIALALGLVLTFVLPAVARYLPLSDFVGTNIVILPWLLLSILGLMFVEQVFRNWRPDLRWGIKHLCLGVGALFAYDFYMYADALLFRQLDADLWTARGFVNVLVVPLMAVSAARNPGWALNVHVSRHVIFHSSTLVGAGVYLMAMAAAGYYIRYFGGTWGSVLQITFLFAGGLLLLLLLFSGQIRSHLRVFLSKHFFSFKYDYREEWLRFTRMLAAKDENLAEAVVKALAAIVDSPGGMLWVKRDETVFELAAHWNMPEPTEHSEPTNGGLIPFLERSGWLADLDEYELEPESYQGLQLPPWLEQQPDAWLVIPLFSQEELCGFVVLAQPMAKRPINWEDRDLLKTAGRQAASHILQRKADQALIHARQFEAFNQLSAYVVHDLKNILAQQSLIVANAEKHKHKPEFIEDVVTTVRSSVDRMHRLMEQLRQGMRGEQRVAVVLDELLLDTVAQRSKQQPVPGADHLEPGLVVEADRERLATVFGHIVQNAQEATRAEGRVVIRLRHANGRAEIEVEDNGVGMTPEFIRERLFRPFDSTKGLTGMGVGAFESRELVRALGGDIRVDSTPGAGTVFRIWLPCRKMVQGARMDARADKEVMH